MSSTHARARNIYTKSHIDHKRTHITRVVEDGSSWSGGGVRFILRHTLQVHDFFHHEIMIAPL